MTMSFTMKAESPSLGSESSEASAALGLGGEPILSVQDLSKNYGSVSVLRDLSFEVCEGEILVLLGPSGRLAGSRHPQAHEEDCLSHQRRCPTV